MPRLPKLWFEHGDERVAEYDAMTIPRVGEEVAGGGGRWFKVAAVEYLYPMPGSPSHRQGEREPIVRIRVEETLAPA
jgi:hypothetical protein